MTHSFLLSLNEAEFKAFSREALTEIWGRRSTRLMRICPTSSMYQRQHLFWSCKYPHFTRRLPHAWFLTLRKGTGCIFPRITKEEAELFNILHRTYSDVRNKEEYKVSGDTVFILIERAKRLLDVAEEIYQGKKAWLKSTLTSDQINAQELPPFESICIDIFTDVILQKGESESIRIEWAGGNFKLRLTRTGKQPAKQVNQ